jgi:hypothetical protein
MFPDYEEAVVNKRQLYRGIGIAKETIVIK